MSRTKYIHGASESEQERLSKLNLLTNESFIKFINCNPSDKILELGSGLGILAELISRNLSNGKVTGIELLAKQIRSCPPKSKNLEFIRGDVHELPFADSSFDKIYGRYILEHISYPVRALREALRVLKPGGEISIQENSILLIEFYPACPKFKKIWKKFASLQHKLGGDSMIGLKLYYLLLKAGFQKVELSSAPEIHWHGKDSFEPWIENLIKNIEGVSLDLIRYKLATKAQIKNAIEELNEFKENPLASTYFYWNRAKAHK